MINGHNAASSTRTQQCYDGEELSDRQEADIDVRFITPGRVELYGASELPALLSRADGLVWVDIPVWEEQAEETLRTTFGFHPLAIRDSANRNQVPKIHRYEDHLFLVLHGPLVKPQRELDAALADVTVEHPAFALDKTVFHSTWSTRRQVQKTKSIISEPNRPL